MKRILLAGIASLALAGPAWAQIPVTDIGSHVLQQLGVANQVSELAKWGQQLAAMQQQYNQLMTTYNSMAHVTDMGSAVTALGGIGIQNPLPVDAYSIQSMLSGKGTPTGMLSSLTGLLNQTTTQNVVYKPADGSWSSQTLNQNGSGIAGGQALILQLYQSAAQRIPLLNQLQEQINTAPDQSTREALIARFGAENAYIQNANVQMNAVTGYMQAQQTLVGQQQQEKLQQDIDSVLSDARSRGIIP